MAAMRATYFLGWLFLIIAVIERAMLSSASVSRMALERNVLPRNFIELSLLFFVIAIASERCCGSKS
jgi:hypothetical protein